MLLTKNKRLLALQGWRAIMMIMIFILHVCPETIPLLAGGNETLSYFIILSGFVLTYSYKDQYQCNIKDIFAFTSKFLKKVYPLHVGLLLIWLIYLSLIAIRTENYAEIPSLLLKFLLDGLLVQSLIPNPEFYFSLNGVSWYLSTTLFFYMSFIPSFKVAKKLQKRNLSIVTCGILLLIHTTIVGLLQFNSSFSFWTYIFPIFRYLEFFFGINLCFIIQKNRQFFESKISVLGATLLEISVILIFILERYLCAYTNIYNPPYNYTSAIAFAIAGLIVLVFSLEKGIVSKLLSNKVFVFLGDISFEFYLVHTTVLEMSFILINITNLPQIKIPFVAIISFLTAFLLYFVRSKRKSVH